MKRLQFSLRTSLIAVAVLGIGLGLFLVARERLQNRVAVRNLSGQTIERLSIAVDGGSGTFVMFWQDLPPDSHVSSTFDIVGDQHFLIEGCLSDGTEFRESHGYVTGGMRGVRVNVLVNAGGRIDFRQN